MAKALKKETTPVAAAATAPNPDEGNDADETLAPAQLGSQETDWEVADPAWVSEDYSDYTEEAKERKARGAVVKPEKGPSTWRALPPVKGTRRLIFRGWTHAVNNEVLGDIINLLADLPDPERAQVSLYLGVEDICERTLGDGFKATWCPSKMRDADCFLCKVSSVLSKIGRGGGPHAKEADLLGREIRSREEFFINAVRMDKKDEMERGPRILQLPQKLYEKVNRIFLNQETGGDFSHPVEGFNLVIDRIESGEQIKLPNGKTIPKTEYDVAGARNKSKLANMDWLKHMNDLSRAREESDDMSMRGLFEGDGRPSKGPATPASRQLASAGDGEDWIEDPENPGDFDYRKNLRAAGRKV